MRLLFITLILAGCAGAGGLFTGSADSSDSAASDRGQEDPIQQQDDRQRPSDDNEGIAGYLVNPELIAIAESSAGDMAVDLILPAGTIVNAAGEPAALVIAIQTIPIAQVSISENISWSEPSQIYTTTSLADGSLTVENIAIGSDEIVSIVVIGEDGNANSILKDADGSRSTGAVLDLNEVWPIDSRQSNIVSYLDAEITVPATASPFYRFERNIEFTIEETRLGQPFDIETGDTVIPVVYELPATARLVTVTAEGEWQEFPGQPPYRRGPDGTESLVEATFEGYPRSNIGAIEAPVASLIGMWTQGNSEPGDGLLQLQVIGSAAELSVPPLATELVLGFHDGMNWADNLGEITVRLRVTY